MLPTLHFKFEVLHLNWVVATSNFLLAVAVVLSWLFLAVVFSRYIKVWQITAVIFGTTVFALLGARLFHVIWERPEFFMIHPGQIFSRWDGMTLYGGLALGVIGFYWLSSNLVFKSVQNKFRDAVAICVAFSLGLLRLGCLANGCCWGKFTDLPWGVTYWHEHSAMPNLGIPVHPTQVYESILGMGIGLLLTGLFFSRNENYKGRLLALFFCLYSLGRFGIEYFRGDSFRGVNLVYGLSTSQLISILVFLALVVNKRVFRSESIRVIGFLIFSSIFFGCANLPKPPDSTLIESTEIVSVPATSPTAKNEQLFIHSFHTLKPHGRTLIFAAYTPELQKPLQSRLQATYSKILNSNESPRIEDVAWWTLAPGLSSIYDKVIQIPPNSLSWPALTQAIQTAESLGKPYDLFLMTHGIHNYIVASEGNPMISYENIASLRGQAPNLILVYMQSCFGSTLAVDWIQAGAKSVIAFDGLSDNFFFINFFILNYSQNLTDIKKSFEMTNSKIRSRILKNKIYSSIATQIALMNPEIIKANREWRRVHPTNQPHSIVEDYLAQMADPLLF